MNAKDGTTEHRCEGYENAGWQKSRIGFISLSVPHLSPQKAILVSVPLPLVPESLQKGNVMKTPVAVLALLYIMCSAPGAYAGDVAGCIAKPSWPQTPIFIMPEETACSDCGTRFGVAERSVVAHIPGWADYIFPGVAAARTVVVCPDCKAYRIVCPEINPDIYNI